MIIKSIKFENFRPFYGIQKMDFTCENDKNVVVVLAQNACGKTTLILSFIWCLYGRSKFENKDEILNRHVERNMQSGDTKKASVEVMLVHDGKTIIVKRTNSYQKGFYGNIKLNSENFSVTSIDESGEVRECGKTHNEMQNYINAILPEDLSSYFFFEGEKNNSIENKDISNSVKKLLGLDAYTNMMSHLYGETTTRAAKDSVMGYYEGKINQSASNDVQDLYNRIQAIQEKQNKLFGKLEEEKSSLAEYDSKIEKINQQLRDAAPTKEVQKERDSLAISIEKNKNRINNLQKQIFRDFSAGSFALFLTPLLPKLSDRLDEMEISDKGITGIDIHAIRQLLQRGYCLCGNDLHKGTPACKNVEKYIDLVPPNSVGTLVKGMNDKIQSIKLRGEQYYQSFNYAMKDLSQCYEDIEEYQRKEDACIERLKSMPDTNIGELENSSSIYKRRKSECINNINSLNREIGSLVQHLETLNNNLNMQKSKTDASDKNQLYYEYAEEIYKWVKEDYKKKEKLLLVELQEKFQKLFNNIYVGDREAKIDERYQLHVYADGDEMSLTGGLHIIKYFSFVGALVQQAGEAINKEKSDISAEEDYPLVLDAAFSHTDDDHTKGIAKELSNVTKQLVLAIMEKDWNYAKEGIDNKVSKMYRINKISEDQSEIVLA